MTYLRYLCLFAYSGVFLIYFVGLRSLSAVPNAASLSGLSFFCIAPSLFCSVYFEEIIKNVKSIKLMQKLYQKQFFFNQQIHLLDKTNVRISLYLHTSTEFTIAWWRSHLITLEMLTHMWTTIAWWRSHPITLEMLTHMWTFHNVFTFFILKLPMAVFFSIFYMDITIQ
jgi:hypothetical protein